MTATFKEFREKSIKGAQLRKSLSDQRILSWRPIEEEVTLVCHKIHKILQEDDKISQDAATDIIDGIRAGCNSVDGKAATRIISSLMHRFMDWRENKASEMTYRMLSSQDDCQLMIPDLTVYVDTVPNINFELLTIEVKKQGNCSNRSLEKGLVKLGKEMQLALNKLIIYKVQKPTVMGLLVEGLKMTAFRMDLEFDGQYRMLEIAQVFLVRDNKCDILLVPTIMQVLTQVKEEIEVTRTNLFKAIKGQGVTTDEKGYMRKSCSSPLVVDADGKGKNKEN
ncbi:MAG: hypothetical protein EXX96DRAFT_471779 [Benjaminiella poitrasii]|nr:MAG: hypothetical protein EXX96DRAFT_471779 [Benjaminiella poitrasii]